MIAVVISCNPEASRYLLKTPTVSIKKAVIFIIFFKVTHSQLIRLNFNSLMFHTTKLLSILCQELTTNSYLYNRPYRIIITWRNKVLHTTAGIMPLLVQTLADTDGFISLSHKLIHVCTVNCEDPPAALVSVTSVTHCRVPGSIRLSE